MFTCKSCKSATNASTTTTPISGPSTTTASPGLLDRSQRGYLYYHCSHQGCRTIVASSVQNPRGSMLFCKTHEAAAKFFKAASQPPNTRPRLGGRDFSRHLLYSTTPDDRAVSNEKKRKRGAVDEESKNETIKRFVRERESSSRTSADPQIRITSVELITARDHIGSKQPSTLANQKTNLETRGSDQLSNSRLVKPLYELFILQTNQSAQLHSPYYSC